MLLMRLTEFLGMFNGKQGSNMVLVTVALEDKSDGKHFLYISFDYYPLPKQCM